MPHPLIPRSLRGAALIAAIALAAIPPHPRTPAGAGPHDRLGPEGADQWFAIQRAAPDGIVHLEARAAAIAATRDLRAGAMASPDRAFADPVWEPLGPTNIGGRVTDVAGVGAVVYVAAASGGVWKTGDAGASWAPIFDGNGTLAIGALAVHPGNPDTIYVGTGEANPGGGSLAYNGNGIWKSVNGGASWTHLGLEATGSVGRLAMDPQRPDRVFAATMGSLFSPNASRGLYRTEDGGATWENVLFLNDSTGCVDVAIDPSNPDRVFAVTWERTRRAHSRDYGGSSSGIFRSLDGGDNWTRLANGLPEPPVQVGRIGMAIAPSDPRILYASYSDPAGFEMGFYKSTDGGDSWALTLQDPLDGDSSFAWWFGRVWVDSADPLKVWVAGLLLHGSTDGGDSWTPVTSMHVDHHAMWTSAANPSVIWEGNDGGIYSSPNGGLSWNHVTQFPDNQLYTIEVHPAEPLKTYAGMQDHGVARTLGPSGDWSVILRGDGQYTIVDPLATNVIYAATQYGALRRSTNGGTNWSNATSGIAGSDRKNWQTPVVADPNGPGYPNTRLYYGANRLYRSTNSATTWAAVSPDLTDGAGGSGGVVFGTITTVAVSPVDSATIYAGTDDGNLWVSSDYAASWQSAESGLPKRWVTRITADPADPARAYATFSGLRWNEPLPHVFRTDDRGASWTDISGDLPDVPVNDLVVDSRNPAMLYVATDVGVFATASGGASWTPLGSGMPEGVVVTDLEFIEGPNPMVYAATYGRSAYRVDLSGKVASVAPEAAPGPRLEASRPNPWRAGMAVEFTLPAAGHARLLVLDVFGRRVATLAEGRFEAGRHRRSWDGRAASGRPAAAGVYFLRLEAGGRIATGRTTRLP